MNKRPNIPHTNPLIPRTTRTPPLRPKQTPVHPRHELRVRAHLPNLLPHSLRGIHPVLHWIRIPRFTIIAVPPDATRHVVGGGEEEVGEVRGPGEFSDGIFVAGEDGEGAGVRGADVEGAD